MLIQFHVALSSTCALVGELDGSRPGLAAGREHALAAVEIAMLSGVPNLVGWAHAGSDWIALREGNLGEAISAGENVETIFASLSTPPLSGGICALAEARVEAGQERRGRDGLLSACGGENLPELEPAFRPWAYEVLARAEAGLADAEAAQRWAELAGKAASPMGLVRDEASALTARAAAGLAIAGKDGHRDAKVAAAGAVDAALRAGSPIATGRARIVLGEALLAGGEEEAAAESLEQAFAEAMETGAQRDRDRAATLLRRLGRSARAPASRPAAQVGVVALSERERQVADLVVERLTNREIAERLYLSEKTIERHLGSAFRKLGVSSRVELAKAVERDSGDPLTG